MLKTDFKHIRKLLCLHPGTKVLVETERVQGYLFAFYIEVCNTNKRTHDDARIQRGRKETRKK